MDRDPKSGKKPPQSNASKVTESKEVLASLLRPIARSRTRLLVCFLTLPVYMIAVWILLNNQRSVDSFMFIYMGVWSAFAIDMARRRCPQCGEQFFVKYILLNLRTHRCVHCSLSYDTLRSEEDEDKMNF